MPPDAALTVTSDTGPDVPAVVLDDLHVTYKVFEDVRPTLRRFVTNRFKPREYTPIPALRGVSLTVEKGETVGIIGRNGSGKSTMLKAIAGLLPPSSGSVLATAQPVLLAVGAALRPDLSGRRNIFLGGSAIGMANDEITARLDEIIEFAGLAHAIDRPLKTYSSGMSARLQFSIASAIQPEILLIDEALAVGDAEFRRKSAARVREMHDAAGTVFIVSHGAGLRDLCTRVVWIDEGLMVMDGAPEEVVAAYEEATGTTAPAPSLG